MLACPVCSAQYAPGATRCGLDGAALVEVLVDPLIGHMLDRYRVVSLIGHGGMGRVYRAQHAVLHGMHAIKVLSGEMASDHANVERFRREAQSISRMRHPNIVAVSDFATTPQGLPFLVMELLEGKPLDVVIREEGKLTPSRTLRLAKQVLEGISAAHALELVHRDLKPSNLFLVQERGEERVKILDFGLVGEVGGGAVRLTQKGFVVGTPWYMAPEQMVDSAVSPAADLYSLGVILFEMLSGQVPFPEANDAKLRQKVMFDAPPKLPETGGLEAIVARLLAKLPAERPASAAEVLEALGRCNIPEREHDTLVDMPVDPSAVLSFDDRTEAE